MEKSNNTLSSNSGNRACLLLGSNIEPERNLPAAVRELRRYGRVAAVSRVWQSPPAGFVEQADFLNAAVLLETPLSAGELRTTAIAAIERALGRVRDPRNPDAPRTIDIDVVLFNRDVLEIGDRRIPDPDVLRRPFVTIPLAELDPDYVHPENGRTLRDIAGRFDPAACGMKLRPEVSLDT
jgi:2-amino-4-hydroxy-6-hydroxymethyldihydropteridine diphosphokinase